MCDKHPKYKAVRRPQSCIDCWLDFIDKNPDKVVRLSDMKMLVGSFVKIVDKVLESLRDAKE